MGETVERKEVGGEVDEMQQGKPLAIALLQWPKTFIRHSFCKRTSSLSTNLRQCACLEKQLRILATWCVVDGCKMKQASSFPFHYSFRMVTEQERASSRQLAMIVCKLGGLSDI